MNALHATTLDPTATRRNMEALQEMMRTEGWQLFLAHCAMQEKAILGALISSADPNVLLRNSGALAQHRIVSTWPQLQVDAFRQQLDAANKRAQATPAQKESPHA